MKLPIILIQDVPPNIRLEIETKGIPDVVVLSYQIYVRKPLTCNPTVYGKAVVHYANDPLEVDP